MKTYNCIVVDDEELARKLLETYIERIPQLKLVGKYKNPIEALSKIQNNEVDILLLDIHMPEISGIDFIKTIRPDVQVIFTTAFKEYALEGYRLNVIDYLLKPIEFSLFFQATSKAMERIHFSTTIHPTGSSVENELTTKNHLLVKSEHRIIRLNYSEIIYIEGMNEYVAIHTQSRRIMTLYSLKKLEQELPSNLFIRSHKSYIVAINEVKELEGNLLHIHHQKLAIGGSYKTEVIKRIFNK